MHDFWPFCGAEHYLHYDLKNMILSDERYKMVTKNNKSHFDKGRDLTKNMAKEERIGKKLISSAQVNGCMKAQSKVFMKDWD